MTATIGHVREHFYSSTWIDRAEHRRGESDWLRARLADGSARIIPVWQQQSLVRIGDDVRAVEVDGDDLDGSTDPSTVFFLGIDPEGRPCFSALLESDDAGDELAARTAGQFADLRRVGGLLPADEAGLLAYARALTYWHETHRFCGACGSASAVERGGWLRRCSNPDCGRQHFPRTDPAVIVRVEYEDRVLLGRQPNWPPKWYSVLAGFVEPGESLEEAVRREVLEESGVTVQDIRYDSSQPWPFPASLMLGFTARAESLELNIDSEELEDARWLTRDEIHAAVAAEELHLSMKQSISRHLLDSWLEAAE
jgi:NAD+ diphosphatase